MAVPSRNAPLVWVLHDGKPGMASQALGLAEATGFPFVEKQLSVNRPWAWLPPQLWLAPLRVASEGDVRLAPPWPDLVIGCGRHSAMPALAIRRASGGRTFAAQVQDPRIGRGKFDLLFVPEHDRLRGPRVVVTRGAIHRMTPVRLTEQGRRFPGLAGLPRPILGVLIGGANRSYRLGLDRLAAIAEAIAAILRAVGGSAVVTPSRRTGAAGLALLRQHLVGLPAEIWDGTGKPVHIIELEGGDAKFARFHAAMREAGITRPFTGRIENWSYSPPDDTERAGMLLRNAVLARLEERRRA
ncbi:MAG: hypothetical protein E6G81_13680 [Alphaproteobacteria bacterium]|nr:MAG: hypothetical protein E6G81_13680 [Alphaproteobacteria bacterium]